jgi:hypothetical protein
VGFAPLFWFYASGMAEQSGDPPRERLISALLARLKGSDEQKMNARSLLCRWMDSAEPSNETLRLAAERFARAGSGPFAKWRRASGVLLVVAALAVLLVPAVRPIKGFEDSIEASRSYFESDLYDRTSGHTGLDRFWDGVVTMHWFQCSGYFPYDFRTAPSGSGRASDEFAAAATRDMPRAEALAFSGIVHVSQPWERAENLWRNYFPENPTCFYNYLSEYETAYKPLPENAVAIAKSIDPDNGFAAFMGGTGEKGVYWTGNYEDNARLWTVRDEKQWRRSLDLLFQASGKPVCTRRTAEWNRRCTSGFRPTSDISVAIARYQSWATYRNHKIRKFYSGGAFAVAAYRYAETGDKQAIRDLSAACLRLARLLVEGAETSNELYLAQNFLCDFADSLHKICKTEGLDEEAAAFSRCREVLLDESRHDRPMNGYPSPARPFLDRHAGLLDRRILLAVDGVFVGDVPVDPEDLVPGRLADYCDIEWQAIRVVGFCLFLFGGVAAVFWCVVSPASWRLGKRLARMPGLADRAWILGLGTLAPLAWHVLATRTPLFHARDFGLACDELPTALLVAVQDIATLLLIVVSTIQAVRWRLGVRWRVFGPAPRRFVRFWWAPVALSASIIPLAGLAAYWSGSWVPSRVDSLAFLGLPNRWVVLLPPLVLLAGVFLWLVGLGFASLADRNRRVPFAAAASLVFASSCAPAVLVLALVASPLVKLEFRRHVLADPIIQILPEWDGTTKYEFLHVAKNRERMLRGMEGGQGD